MKTYKFIGGPADGQEAHDIVGDKFKLPVIDGDQTRYVEYTRIHLIFSVDHNLPSARATVYCTEDMINSHIIERLVEGYAGVKNHDS